MKPERASRKLADGTGRIDLLLTAHRRKNPVGGFSNPLWSIELIAARRTVKRYHDETHDQLRQHLGDFGAAYNSGRRFKTLKGLTPYEAICKTWLKEPHRFPSDPTHQIPGPNTFCSKWRLSR